MCPLEDTLWPSLGGPPLGTERLELVHHAEVPNTHPPWRAWPTCNWRLLLHPFRIVCFLHLFQKPSVVQVTNIKLF